MQIDILAFYSKSKEVNNDISWKLFQIPVEAVYIHSIKFISKWWKVKNYQINR